ncbi:hypothetical protein QGM71_14680 [Virgibacillus sp. C22-A2]|uniref:YhfM-like domain-containing protein n=1 Tax=Virgibacillus tibetensis TaxID=3042313 RepID=A0ABU6KHT2_9BACI|nr:hypothetical protein [Virgibacillus sp. C22-A2]
MRNIFIFIIFISMLFVSLSACQKEDEKLKGLVIESSSVEFGSLQNPEDRELHFRVQINDYGMESEQEYKVRFIIQDAHISDLIATEKIEVPETYKTQLLRNDEARTIVTGGSKEIKKDFTIDEIRKIIEKDEAVIIELYDKNRTIDREVVTTFAENIKPLVKVNPNAKLEHIKLKETNEIDIFSRAISDSNKEQGISYIAYPEYTFSLAEESYFLWVTENNGRIMNTKDTYTIYSLSDSSLKEVKEVIDKK